MSVYTVVINPEKYSSIGRMKILLKLLLAGLYVCSKKLYQNYFLKLLFRQTRVVKHMPVSRVQFMYFWGTVVPLNVILLHVLSETMPVSNTPLFWREEQLQNRKRTCHCDISLFIFNLHLFASFQCSHKLSYEWFPANYGIIGKHSFYMLWSIKLSQTIAVCMKTRLHTYTFISLS